MGYKKDAYITPHHDLKGAFCKSMAIITFSDVTFHFNRPKTYGYNQIKLKKGDILIIQQGTWSEIWWKHSIKKVVDDRMACVVRLVTKKK